MVSAANTIHLLSNTKRIITHHKELEILKGEKFNIFSILRMETKENTTHSAFLGELLNPKGTHSKDSVFLRLFLQTINNHNIDIDSASVQLEHHIGKRNNEEKVGGRIDIFIRDKNNNSISIENKIYAYDQFAQIERYVNYKIGKNTVYYLSLNGNEPSMESKGQLKSNEDYYILSYREHIVLWLKLCMKEAADAPILRETIRQYIILIQKLTSTMENATEKELIDIMLNHYEEASYIASNFNKARQAICESLRQTVIKMLDNKLKNQYNVVAGQTTQYKYSQIWITLKEKPNSKLFFGVESFSGEGNFNGQLFIGVFNEGETKSKYAEIKGNTEYSKCWINTQYLTNYDGYILNLSNQETILKLHNDKEFERGLVEHIVFEIENYLSKETKPLLVFLNK